MGLLWHNPTYSFGSYSVVQTLESGSKIRRAAMSIASYNSSNAPFLHCRSRGVGRLVKDVDVDSILALHSLNYTWTKIASLLGISRRTLYRRLAEAGISTDDRTQLSEGELDDIIRSLKYNHPNDGEVLIQGQLLSMGVRVPRLALRDSIHRVDHHNAAFRTHSVVRRRVYSVPFPKNNYILCGTLIATTRWRGGVLLFMELYIDGFSHTVIYLRCFDNNQASTILDLFVEGVSQFGLPDRVRSDCGRENVDVWRFMISTHHRDFSSVITGSSVHNERVERLWRDVHRCVASVFACTFNHPITILYTCTCVALLLD